MGELLSGGSDEHWAGVLDLDALVAGSRDLFSLANAALASNGRELAPIHSPAVARMA